MKKVLEGGPNQGHIGGLIALVGQQELVLDLDSRPLESTFACFS